MYKFCVYTVLSSCVSLVPKEAIRECLVSLEVEVQVVVNHHEGAEN